MKSGPHKDFPVATDGKKVSLKGYGGKLVTFHRKRNKRNISSRRPGKFVNGRRRKGQDQRFIRWTTTRINAKC
jgi:hypothetical protein